MHKRNTKTASLYRTKKIGHEQSRKWECCRNMDKLITDCHIHTSFSNQRESQAATATENTGVPHNITSRSLSLQHHQHQASTILTMQAKSNGQS